MSGSSDQLAVMRPAYMSLPSPNITCPEEDQGNPLEVQTEKYKESQDSDDFLFRVNRAGWPGTPAVTWRMSQEGRWSRVWREEELWCLPRLISGAQRGRGSGRVTLHHQGRGRGSERAAPALTP